MKWGLALLLSLMPFWAVAAPRRVLYVTHSAGFRHDSIPVSIDVLRGLSREQLEVTATEDLSVITRERLQDFDAVFFFTSGELALADNQKQALLDFVQAGKGFGGAHSATDTLYTWPEYKTLIGATFDGHPWVQSIRIDVEDPENPVVSHLTPGFEITDEIYQFRDYSRGRLRVLMTADTTSIDTHADGVHRSDDDFALAWMQPYGRGRVFYTALGHFESTWQDARFQTMLRNALLWLTGQSEAPSAPRPVSQPSIDTDDTGPAIGNAATLSPRGLSPGTIFTIFGRNLTSGSQSTAVISGAPFKLAGARVFVGGEPARLLYASPQQINAVAPDNMSQGTIQVDVPAPGMAAASVSVGAFDHTPGVFTSTVSANTLTVWATGLGAVVTDGAVQRTVWQPKVEVNGVGVQVLFSGLAPGWPGLYQINTILPSGASPPFQVRLPD